MCLCLFRFHSVTMCFVCCSASLYGGFVFLNCCFLSLCGHIVTLSTFFKTCLWELCVSSLFCICLWGTHVHSHVFMGAVCLFVVVFCLFIIIMYLFLVMLSHCVDFSSVYGSFVKAICLFVVILCICGCVLLLHIVLVNLFEIMLSLCSFVSLQGDLCFCCHVVSLCSFSSVDGKVICLCVVCFGLYIVIVYPFMLMLSFCDHFSSVYGSYVSACGCLLSLYCHIVCI